jgi:hypothetical protein
MIGEFMLTFFVVTSLTENVSDIQGLAVNREFQDPRARYSTCPVTYYSCHLLKGHYLYSDYPWCKILPIGLLVRVT